jgi:NDP-sugar pyrophosphorylase family protein
MQIVILAGGLATRLKRITRSIPKSMIKVDGKPFLQHQIELLRENGIREMVLCVGHLSHLIRDHFGDGRELGVEIKYSDEGENLLGTGGALKKAEPLLQDRFFLTYGDSYLLLDYQAIQSHHRRCSDFCLLTVYENHNQYDNSNVAVEDGLVTIYDKSNPDGELRYIDAGLSILNKEVLSQVPADRPSPLEELYQNIVGRRQMLAYQVSQRFYEIGSFVGLMEFEELMESQKQLVG